MLLPVSRLVVLAAPLCKGGQGALLAWTLGTDSLTANGEETAVAANKKERSPFERCIMKNGKNPVEVLTLDVEDENAGVLSI